MSIRSIAAKCLAIVILTLPFYRCFAQDSVYEIDLAHQAPPKITPLDFSGTNPEGTALSVNNRYFVRDGKPWFPLMGEFHYSRYPQQYWEEEIVKMKSAGLSIIATYIFWDVHENPRDHWNWQGMFDLRHFIELCAKHQMYVWIRIGPYDNAELVYGGLPKWIAGLKGKRSNDPAYLAEASKLYRQIGEQTKGLYFKDGGPIIGTQLENEYDINEKDHIGTLKQLALKSGITPVFFSVTANTVFRDDKFEVIPLQGAYPYRGWEKAGGSSSKDFLYGNDQWIMTDALGKVFYDTDKYPKGLCEQGCGGQITYANRFVVNPGIVEAHLQNQIGRGMNMVGYYMFQGGTQLAEFKKSDCPVSYDFQAPLSEFGFVQPSYRYLKILHNFLRDFGSDLAAMNVVESPNPVRNGYDTADLRYVVRTSGNSGFVFLCNTQVRVHMPDKVFRMRLKLAGETIGFPRAPLHFDGGTTAILPFNLLLNGALLKYATAQPVGRFSWDNKQVLFLTEVKGMNTELAFDEKTIAGIKADGWKIEKSGGKIYLTPDGGREILIKSSTGRSSLIILLTREQAENSWRTTINKQEVMVISKADLMFGNGGIECRQAGNPFFSLDVYPSDKFIKAGGPAALFKRYEFRVPAVSLQLDTERIAPDRIAIVKPTRLPASVSDIRLQIDYLGGSAEIRANDQILTDNLFNGSTWSLGLKRYISDDTITKIECRALPWQDYITGVPDSLVRKVQEGAPRIISIKAIPEYRFWCPGINAQGANPILPLIPLPKNFSGYKENGLSLRRLVIGVNDDRLHPLTGVLGEEIRVVSGMDICTDKAAGITGGKAAVNLEIDLDDRLPEGEYTMVIGKTIQVKAGSYRSACWATASLLQLMKPENGRLVFPLVSIKDWPSADYRGVLLDVARNWTEPATIRSVIRICRFYKINYLQLHLSDNESFTFPSQAFPALPTPGRHYSMDTLQALIRFADDRGVTLVPELELPGHSAAMRREMPGLFGGKTPDYIDVSKPEVLAAAKTIVREISDVFHSSPYIHIGADESGFGQLDQYIVDMDKYIRSLGKTTLLWESFSGKGDRKAIIPGDVIVFAFETLYERPDSLINNGYDVVNASWKPLYITPGWRWTPKDIYNGWDVDTWKNHWEITPSYNTIKVPDTDKIKGAELCTWVMPDYVDVPEILARAPAFAEKTWNTQVRLPFDRFSRISQALNVTLRKFIFPAKLVITGISEPVYPGLENTGNIFAGDMTIDCAPYSRKGFVTYSLNGKFPAADSNRLTGPLHITKACDVQLAAYDSAGNPEGYYHNYFVRQPLSFSIAGNYTYPRDIDIEDRVIIIRNPVRIFIKSAAAGKGSVLYKLNGMNAFSPYTGKGILIKNDAVIYAKFIDDDGNAIGRDIKLSVKKAETPGIPGKDGLRAIGHIALDALDVSKIYQGIDRPRDVGERAGISIRGTRFLQGVHTRTESRLYVALDGNVHFFAATVGVDDRSGRGGGGPGDADTAQFYVIGDGAILWRSGTMSQADSVRRCDVRIDGVKRLLLQVTGHKTAAHIHVDWADASFAYSGVAPHTTWSPEDEAVDRVAPQPPEPRINGALAVGIRPQTPFYYPMAVTGKRPFVITVEGLPGGLHFDRETGIIKGIPETRGDYRVRLQVSNSVGTARRTLRILVGDTLALTPPMGFLSWNIIQGLISATVLKEMGDAFLRYGLRDVGYQYIMMDDCWAGGRDAQGNIFPDSTRFPDGMKAVGDYLHERGFKLGIYSSPGAVTCGGYPGTLGHESQDAHTWTGWGVDYLKYDLCSAPRDRALDLYKQMGELLEKSGRSVVYALGAGGEEGRGWGAPAHAQVWRTGVDIRDQWTMKWKGGIIDCFDAQASFAGYQHPGGWNDPDMLLAGIYGKGASSNDLGATGCNDTEYRSQMSLWSLLSAPLFISADVRNIRPSALKILTNPEVIDVDQDVLGDPPVQHGVKGDLEIWVKDLADGSKAIGLLNRKDSSARMTVHWADIGLNGKQEVRDLWLRKEIGWQATGYTALVPPHGVILIRVYP